MAKRIYFLTVLLIFSLASLVLAVDLGQLFSQVKSGLLQQGVSAADIKTIQPAASGLLGLGLGKEDLTRIVVDLVKLGISGNALNNPLQALKSLVEAGEKPGLASNLVSLAINQVKSQNLTGNAAVSKIVSMINQKKDEFVALKRQAQGKIHEGKDKINKSLGSFLGK